MQHPELNKLVELASQELGSQRELAAWLEVTEQRITEWKNGHRTCPPEVVAAIAFAAKKDPGQWLARATLWKCEGKTTEKRAREALGKALRVTGAALALCFAPGLVEAIRHSTMYRK
jgi:plasmid maintenance system antidote protein VapI